MAPMYSIVGASGAPTQPYPTHPRLRESALEGLILAPPLNFSDLSYTLPTNFTWNRFILVTTFFLLANTKPRHVEESV